MGSVSFPIPVNWCRNLFDQVLVDQSDWGWIFALPIDQSFLEDGASAFWQASFKETKTVIAAFWSVVVSIELMDIVFSVDSILASLAISPNPVIVLIGGMIGILCMRGIAEVIIQLMKKIPELEVMAYALIALIAIKLFISIPAIDIEIPAAIFGMIVLIAVVITLIVHQLRKRRGSSSK